MDKSITITVRGGLVDAVIFGQDVPDDVQVVICDYDVDGSSNFEEPDEEGDLHIKSIYKKEN